MKQRTPSVNHAGSINPKTNSRFTKSGPGLRQFVRGIAVAAAFWCSATQTAYCAPPAGQPILNVFQNRYWRWAYGQITLPVDSNGNALAGTVAMLALPNAPGDGTPGSIEITLNSNQMFFLPLWNLLGTSYTDGHAPDPFVDITVFTTLDLTFKIDGNPVITTQNLMRYFSRFRYEPPIPLNSPPYDSIIWLEGISILHLPLSPGIHTMTLDAVNTEPAFGGFFEYHNTWNVTVKDTEH